MAKSLIITEKPSVAQEFARILEVSGRRDGYLENDSYVITWCVGHLVEMVYPEEYDIKYKKWRLEDLPFLPREYKYHVIPGVRKQYDVVHKMLHRADIDTVYWAGDAGKEGQTIEENIRKFGGVREGMRERRVWIDSQTKEEILRGIREAKDMSEYDNLAKSGVMRTIEDYAVGINFSRVMSVKYGKMLNDAAGTKSYTAIAVGRVMTCVLGMVVIREREIRDFAETPFYRVAGRFAGPAGEIGAEWKAVGGSKYFESPLLYKENGFKKEESARALIAELTGKKASVSSIEKGVQKKRAPLLFNLAELQAECSKRFKISPDETLAAAQELYEKKLTTYPRTDARVLSSAVAKEIGRNIGGLRRYEPTAVFAERIMKEGKYKKIADTQYTDDAKITDHYAIIPTGQLTELSSLNRLQSRVFELIVRRFLSIFYPPAEYQTAKLAVEVGREMFFASAKALKEPGYLEIAGIPQAARTTDGKAARDFSGQGKEEDTGGFGEAGARDSGEGGFSEKENSALLAAAAQLKKGDVLEVNGFFVREGKTSPPKRYTSGSMVLAMENAGQLIEDEELRAQIRGSGIGTSATRAEIIKKLIRVGYLNLNKKTQVLSPERLGEMIFEVVSMTVPALLDPRMTASWEKGLDGITRGTVVMDDYRARLEDFVRREMAAMMEQDLTGQLAAKIQPLIGKGGRPAAGRALGIPCPVCGGEMKTTPFGYGCSNYKKEGNGCRFAVGAIAGRPLNDGELSELLTKGRTGVLSGFVSKAKKEFDASLVLQKEEDGTVRIGFDFSEIQPEVLENVRCPVCGSPMEITSFGYRCAKSSENPEECSFSVGRIAGKSIGVDDLTELLANGRTQVLKGFTAKNKKKFSACLVLETGEDGKKKIVFDFSQNEAEVVAGVSCPVCGGAVEVTAFGYGCANYVKDDPESCRFSIGKMAEKSLTKTNVKELLTKGRTGTIRGFKSKSGKKFDARIALQKDESGKVTGLKFDFSDLEAPRVKDVKCPVCGGEIVKTMFGFGCANYAKDDPGSCRFSVGQIAGVKLKEAQLKELLTNGRTEEIKGFVAKSGMKFDARLKLTEDGKAVFDFPERPKPARTEVKCPECGKNLQKSQWYYTCACGFKVSHVVAKAQLSESVIKELLETGRSREKVSGFVSKAGNSFDAWLKFADGQIQFDFERREGGPSGTESAWAGQAEAERGMEEYYDAMAREYAALQAEDS